ncbi:hydrolase [Lentibacillus saliphilus]|uniref:hydrolase n=1 Tax=Lentibacillus saliphilus TaxID=2737028 RepID=UPI001C306654|nr:hydrolase [Lentibacillus saliphilus]
MNRKKYYINIGTTEISQVPYGNNTDFVVYATQSEIVTLRSLMDHMHQADMGSFFRSYVPIMSYHNDRFNHEHDDGLTKAFTLIYQLGSDQTKKHIEEMGVLGDMRL